MKVLTVCHDYPPAAFGGIGYHAAGITRALRRLGVDVMVLTMNHKHVSRSSDPEYIVRAPLAGPNRPRPEDPFLTLQENVSMAVAGASLCLETKFDVIHCHELFTVVAADAIATFHRTPLVLTKHLVLQPGSLQPEAFPGDDPVSVKNVYLEYHYDLQSWCFRRSAHIIAVSKSVFGRLKTLGEEVAGKSTVIPSGTDLSSYPRGVAPGTIRERYSLEGGPLLLMVGRLVWGKGGDVAIRALSLVREIGASLVFVGEGEFRHELEIVAAESSLGNRVRFAGHLEGQDLVDVYRAADMVLVPSRRVEDYPLVVLEAMALGKLVIASRSGGICEQIEHGITGLLSDPGSAEDLARWIRWGLENPDSAAQIRKAAEAYAQRVFEWRPYAEQTLQVYQSVLHQHA